MEPAADSDGGGLAPVEDGVDQGADPLLALGDDRAEQRVPGSA